MLSDCNYVRKLVLLLFSVWVIVAGGQRSLLAAQEQSVLSGRVVDSTGGALPGVTLVVSQPGSGARAIEVTDAEGRFTFVNLPQGRYRLDAQLAGFAPAVIESVELPASNGAIEIVLEPATLHEAVTVTAARTASPLSQIPATVTLIDRETLTRELNVTDNLTDVLAKTVPGMGPSRETEGIFGQSLRGRDMLVLVDGIPQNFELRIGATDELSRVSPSFLERVEVVRGASAAFGASAAGGIVNLITRSPDRGRIEVSLGTSFSATHPGDSFDQRVTLSGGDTRGATSWFGAGSFSGLAGDFDADGDRIPQLFLDSETRLFDVMGRVGHELAPGQQLSVSGVFRHGRLHEAYAPDPGEFGVRPSGAVEVPLGVGTIFDVPLVPLDVPFKREIQAQVGYRHSDVLGSAASVQAYFLDYRRRNTFSDFFGAQLEPDFDKQGVRLDVETPLRTTTLTSLHWGADAARYFHVEPMSDGQAFVPPIRQASVAGFAQLSLALGSRATARGGLRYEHFSVAIDDFVTHPVYGATAVEGGTLTYGAATGNAGITWSVTTDVDLYGGFSQGFSITEVGRLLRDTEVPSVEAAKPEAQRVNNLEAGVRARMGGASLAAAVYRSWSELGTTFSLHPSTGLPFIIRAPERIAGAELAIDVPITAGWRAGGQFSLQSGEYDPDDTDAYRPLPGFRIAPPMLSGYLGVIRAGWDGQIRVSFSGERDEFPGSEEYGEGRVEPVTVVDLAVQREIPGGRLSVAVANLFNRLYVPAPNQAFNSGYLYIAGRGATVSATYTLSFRP
jgi:iron complex outermembrane receptor protein